MTLDRDSRLLGNQYAVKVVTPKPASTKVRPVKLVVSQPRSEK